MLAKLLWKLEMLYMNHLPLSIYEYQMQERSGKKSVINTWILWSIPRLIRALDDKHTVLDYPNVLATQDYKYKRFYSLVLLAIFDARTALW